MQVAVKAKPILFSAPMVRAILDGKKTQTRRVLKVAPHPAVKDWVVDSEGRAAARAHSEAVAQQYVTTFPHGRVLCPYEIGTHLWVRETWLQFDKCHWEDSTAPKDWLSRTFGVPRRNACAYRADTSSDGEEVRQEYGYKWKPSIHMPRWASRINLEVTGVRVERVQDITEADAIAEGALTLGKVLATPGTDVNDAARTFFQMLWDKLNKPRGFGWDANPWVWVIEFKRV